MRPTLGVVAALIGSVILHVLGRITGGGWLALASAAAVVLPVAALLLRPRLDGLDVSSQPVRARVGDQIEVRLVVRNTASRPSPPVRLLDTTPGLSPLVVSVPPLAAGAQVVADLRRTAVQRCASSTASMELTSTAPFGLIRVRKALALTSQVVVAPRAVPAVDLADGGLGTADSSRAVAGTGTEVLGLRPWRPGDGARAVHARSSARHGRPVVLERERDTGPAVVVLCAGVGSGPLWEAAVEQACAVAERSLRSQRPPVLLATGLPAPRLPDLTAVLDWHAGLDAALPINAATLAAAARAAGRGGTVVLLAPQSLVLDRVGEVRRACAGTGARVVVVGAVEGVA